MKKLNLVKGAGLDKEASFKYIDEKVHDADWSKVLKSSLDFCIPKMTPKSIEFQKKMGFPIEECNVLFSGIVMCMDIATFMVSVYFQLQKICNEFFFSTALQSLGLMQLGATKPKSSPQIAWTTTKRWESSFECSKQDFS